MSARFKVGRMNEETTETKIEKSAVDANIHIENDA